MTKNIMLLIVYKKGSKKGYVLHYRTTSKEGTYPNILTSYNTLVYKICRISMRTIYSDFKMQVRASTGSGRADVTHCLPLRY